MGYTGNPPHDSAVRDMKHERWLSTRPVCDDCGEPIQDPDFYQVFGFKICPGCIERGHQYIEED